ncbi:MAG: chemotaxis response regulator protein-glutamate methylesterase [Candidatus Omnitrophica bacterium]|nr:chemotaxis response regulator protein-glutamate methylesterase [Candidatus Omnitrophota bacterium]
MIKAVIADDSAFLRTVLRDVLSASNKINVVGAAKNGKEAINFVRDLKPDILILDCEMPVMNGLEALRRIMDATPLPIFMFSSLTQEGASVTLKALEYGAVDFLPKPTRGAHGLEDVAQELIRKVEIVVRKERLRRLSWDKKPSGAPVKKKSPVELTKGKFDLIAIGSSTGGVQAAVEVVKNLPARTRPIVWVQHMPPAFTKSFAERLDDLSAITVKEADEGDVLRDNTCYIARGGLQMRLKKQGMSFKLKVEGNEKVSGHCPSCNVLFNSVQESFSDNVLGVILTGMGEDGADGLLSMHKKGAFVIGQNEQSCVVYGMPKAAHERGAVDIELDVKDIAKAIVKKGGAFT